MVFVRALSGFEAYLGALPRFLFEDIRIFSLEGWLTRVATYSQLIPRLSIRIIDSAKLRRINKRKIGT